MATLRRRTFSGAAVACLLGVAAVSGRVPATAHQLPATDPVLVGLDTCPVAWPVLRGAPPEGEQRDGTVSVLVGGSLIATGTAAGAEGVVVARGNASFTRDAPGDYRVGVTDTGSQVVPHEDSDMLVVGGDLSVGPGTTVDVGRGLRGDVAVGGTATAGAVTLDGGRLDRDVVDPLAPYDAQLGGLAARSGGYAGLPVTGSVEVTGTALTLTGDGVSDPQVFAVDGAGLGSTEGLGRSLQVLGVPDGAAVVVNLTGPVVDLDVDQLLSPSGAVVDPAGDAYFAELATHLLWNAPDAGTVDIGGQAQLPGSLLVAAGRSTTTLAGPGTNGRVLVAGDLVHSAGELHSYPFLPAADLACGPDVEHLGTLTLDVVLKDPGGVVEPERFFEGTFSCHLGDADVTPGDGTWQFRAQAKERVLTGRVPIGAVCVVDERLDVPPAKGWDWGRPDIAPARVKVAKRDPAGFTVTNSVQPEKTPPDPEPTVTSEPTTTPTDPVTPEPTPDEPTAPVGPAEPEPTDGQPETSPDDRPTGDPELSVPAQRPPSEPTPPGSGDGPVETDAAPEPRPGSPGPLTTTAPYSLRGAFVWGPLLLLSVLALRLRFPWRYRRPRRAAGWSSRGL